jgi:hypothetical protein
LGDLGGVRTDLENRGIYLRLNAIAEFAEHRGSAAGRDLGKSNRLLRRHRLAAPRWGHGLLHARDLRQPLGRQRQPSVR